MTLSFNLIDEPWIPVIPRDGPPCEVGLRDALVRAHEWRGVFDNSPLVTVALHRLLLAIFYRALPPRTQDAWDALWDELWQAVRLPEAPIAAYLEQWRDRFDLFSETHPFYQTAGLTIESGNDGASPISRLAHELASGNNATLFDHQSDASGHAMSAASAARLLIAAQAFSMGGGKSGKAILTGKHFNRSNAQHGLLVNGLCAWIAGNTFREALLLNLVPDDFAPDDIPPWEASTAAPAQMILAADSATARGRIDLLTWQARLIRLIGEHHGQETVVHRIYITQGRPAGDTGAVFDPMKSYVRTEDGAYRPMRLTEKRAGWADFHTLLTLAPAKGKRLDAFAHLAGRFTGVSRANKYRVHVVGMVNDQAKVNLWRHEHAFIRPDVLDDPAMIEMLCVLRTETERLEYRLRTTILRMAYYFVVPNANDVDEKTMKSLQSEKPRETDIIEAQAIAKTLDACRCYWTRLEEPFYRLLDDLPTDMDAAATRWRETITREAEHALAEACVSLGTSARALRAIARINPYFGDRQRVATEVRV